MGDDVIIREDVSLCINPLNDNVELIIENRVDLGKRMIFWLQQ